MQTNAPTAVLASFALLLGAGAGCTKTSLPPVGSEATVATGQHAIVARHSETTRVALPATVRSRHEARVGSRVLAKVVRADFAVGMQVREGELLVELDDTDLKARVLQARAADTMAQRDLVREQRLLVEGVSTADAVRLLEDRRAITMAALTEAEAMAGYARVVAPFDGVVLSRHVNSGDLAAPGTPLFTLTSLDDLRVEVEVPESLPTLKVGEAIQVELNGITTPATLSELSPGSEGMSRTRHAKLTLPNASGARPGQFARAQWPAGTSEALTVPATAVSEFGQMERVFVIEEGIARMRIVRTAGTTADGSVRIASGLNQGERVLLHANATLRDGARLTPERAQP